MSKLLKILTDITKFHSLLVIDSDRHDRDHHSIDDR